jgi:hypothetical protein
MKNKIVNILLITLLTGTAAITAKATIVCVENTSTGRCKEAGAACDKRDGTGTGKCRTTGPGSGNGCECK